MRFPRLVSIGYEGRTVEQLVEDLNRERVAVLVDVRLTPLSRKPGLSKRRLAATLADAGIEYVHLKALGNPRHNREPFWQGRVPDGCRFFNELLESPEPQSALTTIAELAADQTVAVLCFERDHDRCHRQVVTSRVIDLLPNRAAGDEIVYA
jgi:uncharacterized protein (DUF488 family)